MFIPYQGWRLWVNFARYARGIYFEFRLSNTLHGYLMYLSTCDYIDEIVQFDGTLKRAKIARSWLGVRPHRS